MVRVKDEQLFTLIKNFFLVYLPTQRKSSPNTVKTYRTVWNQFLDFAAKKKKVPLSKVTMKMLDYDMVNSYLDWLTTEQGAKPATRNNRLAAIRAFFDYASACRPEYMEQSSHLAAIRVQKNDPFGKVDYMTEEAVKALMEAPNISIRIEHRDQFLMIMLYDTGARIQELLDLRICDLRLLVLLSLHTLCHRGYCYRLYRHEQVEELHVLNHGHSPDSVEKPVDYPIHLLLHGFWYFCRLWILQQPCIYFFSPPFAL